VGKIGDLFVRLGLKSDDYKKGMNEAKKETQGFGNTLGKMKAGALAVWAAIGTAVIKFGQDFIGATNKIGDAWAATTANIKAQYHTLLAEMTNYKPDFSSFRNFFKKEWKWIKETIFNAKEAGEAAAEATKAFDQEFELTQSIGIQRRAIQQELNELYAMMRDTTLSPGDRQAAADKYKALLQPIADAEIKVYGNMLDAAIDAWQAGTGLNRTKEDIIEFFKNVGTEAEAMAAKFPDINEVFNNKKGDKQNLVIYDVLGKFQDASNQISNVDRELARTTNSIKANIQRSLEGIADAVKQYGKEELNFDLEIDIEVDEEGMELADAMMQDFIGRLQDDQARIRDLNRMITDSFVQGFADSVQAITDAVFGIEGAGFEQALAAFVRPIANMMKQMGELFMAEGLAELQLISGTPAQKIAAGAALVAIGSAIASGLTKLSGAVGGASTAGASSSTADRVESYEQDITVHVVGTISGSDIVLAGQKTLNKWSR
jgi:hypothetical protein